MAGESEQISQDEIEKLLSQAKTSSGSPDESTSAATPNAAAMSAERASREGADRDVDGASPQPASSQSSPSAGSAPAAKSIATSGGSSVPSGLPASDIEFLFKQAEQALASVQGPQPTPPGVTPYKLTDFGGAPPSTENATLDLLRDVELDLKIELGRTHMYLEDVLRLSKGAVVPLDRLAGDPVDIYVNGRLIARGEVLILNDNFCVRVAELVAGEAPAPAATA
jgi:flagellar motor switch protein FliN/FliY